MSGQKALEKQPMKGIGLLGTKGHVENVYLKTSAQAMRAVGDNTGNLVFEHAVYHMITEKKYIIGDDIPWDMGAIREHCRVIVVPSANHIREDFDLTPFVEFLDRVQLPLVFIGLGAQADNFEKSRFDLHPSILKLIDLVKERAKMVSIRGHYTARVLNSFGIGNVKVTGCPSNFMNPDPLLPDRIAARLEGKMRSFITHGDEPWPLIKEKQDVEKLLATWTMAGAAMQSQQSVPDFMEFIRRNNPYSATNVPESREEALREALMPTATMDQFRDYLAAKLRVYFSVSQWMEDSSKYDFSLGLRLHGNMIAWQVGVPSLWLSHDSRTQELANVMAVPNMNYLEFLEKCKTVSDAWACVKFDKEAYRRRRADLARGLNTVLASEDIKNNLHQIYAPEPQHDPLG